ncbi:MAG: MarR family transcriptional regulator [Myxococcaceae bacterium]|nr:MarR family transcriptional regulator [Myxococcaceae bacterium]MCI0672598.1 MarR family transcriptional regulator [Myxococcaceae bacterium]
MAAADSNGGGALARPPEVSGEPREAEPICEAWQLLFKLLRHFRSHWAGVHGQFDLTPVQGHVLALLEPGMPRPMSGLADLMGCDASNVTGLVDRLEMRRLLERRNAEHDRRVKMLALTAEGERLRSELMERLREPPEELRHLPRADQEALRDAVRRTLQAVGIPEE